MPRKRYHPQLTKNTMGQKGGPFCRFPARPDRLSARPSAQQSTPRILNSNVTDRRQIVLRPRESTVQFQRRNCRPTLADEITPKEGRDVSISARARSRVQSGPRTPRINQNTGLLLPTPNDSARRRCVQTEWPWLRTETTAR